MFTAISTPIQGNSSNCGVHVLAIMEFLAFGTSDEEAKLKTIGPKFINTFREQFLELLRGWSEDRNTKNSS
jgi:hypothetical protein